MCETIIGFSSIILAKQPQQLRSLLCPISDFKIYIYYLQTIYGRPSTGYDLASHQSPL